MRAYVDDVYRDTQYDRGRKTGVNMTRRTIRVLAVDESGVLAQAVTGYDGQPAARAPRRRISYKTLWSCYELASSAA